MHCTLTGRHVGTLGSRRGKEMAGGESLLQGHKASLFSPRGDLLTGLSLQPCPGQPQCAFIWWISPGRDTCYGRSLGPLLVCGPHLPSVPSTSILPAGSCLPIFVLCPCRSLCPESLPLLTPWGAAQPSLQERCLLHHGAPSQAELVPLLCSLMPRAHHHVTHHTTVGLRDGSPPTSLNSPSGDS